MSKYGIIGMLFFLAWGCREQMPAPDGSLEEALHGFVHPQDTARTKVWWFHGETETTREGITADLEAFKRAGVGGVVYYDQVHGRGEGACDAFSPEWWEMLVFASQEAQRLGLSFESHVSNGFVAGGPWITPALGMQLLTSADTVISGGGPVEVALPVPDAPYHYFRDVAVLAFPFCAENWETSREVKPVVTTSVAGLDAEAVFLREGGLVRIAAPEDGKPVLLNMDFGRRFTARSITYRLAPRGKATTSATNVPAAPSDTFVGTGYRVLPDLGELEVSDDGVNYRPVCRLRPIYKAHAGWQRKTLAFPAVTGRYFRLNLHDWQEKDKPREGIRLGEVCLSARACVDQWEEKAGLVSEYIGKDCTPVYAASEGIEAEGIIDLSEKVDSAGALHWEAPDGKWMVMRFGHVPAGRKIKHGRRNLGGLECDKMSAEAAKVQWDHYFRLMADSVAAGGGRLSGMAMDSHEAGSQNWTPGFEREFERLRGYNMLKYLPVMQGYVVGTTEESVRFLYDLRRTVADLIAEKYYGTFQRLCDERGVDFTAQATGNALCIVADPIQAKGRVGKPQGEFWAIHPDGNYDIKESASAARLYGKKIASAEAFTDAQYSHSLSDLKALADYAYAYGINEFVVCASAYQPELDKIPGNTGGGRHYCLNRNNTYWDYSRDFWDYQARCAWLMRQGLSVADLCIYLGENAPVKILTHRLPVLPWGYDFDAFTTDALMWRMDSREGRVVLPDGGSYRMMVLPRNGEITLAALRRIASFAEDGLIVYGTRPVGSGAMCDLGREAEYRELVEQMWGKEATPEGTHRYGKGRIYWGMSLPEAVVRAGIVPDVSAGIGPAQKEKVYFAHRRLSDADLYFMNNRNEEPLCTDFTFRSTGKVAELWHPVTGERYRLAVTARPEGRVTIPLTLAARASFFVVLSDTGTGNLPEPGWGKEKRTEPLTGPWRLSFSEQMGGPGEIELRQLTDWTLSDDPRIKYYSGTAVYRTSFENHTGDSCGRVLLGFEALGGVARVILNGDTVATVWCSPWEADITRAVKAGKNELQIEVANSLMNRMTGDAMLPPEKRITKARPVVASPSGPLVPSGISGRVVIREERR